jgi:hypothetical protein
MNELGKRIKKFDIFGTGRPTTGSVYHYSLPSSIDVQKRIEMGEVALLKYRSNVRYDYPSVVLGLFAKYILRNPTRYHCWELVSDIWMYGGLLQPSPYIPEIEQSLNIIRGTKTLIKRKCNDTRRS